MKQKNKRGQCKNVQMHRICKCDIPDGGAMIQSPTNGFSASSPFKSVFLNKVSK